MKTFKGGKIGDKRDNISEFKIPFRNRPNTEVRLQTKMPIPQRLCLTISDIQEALLLFSKAMRTMRVHWATMGAAAILTHAAQYNLPCRGPQVIDIITQSNGKRKGIESSEEIIQEFKKDVYRKFFKVARIDGIEVVFVILRTYAKKGESKLPQNQTESSTSGLDGLKFPAHEPGYRFVERLHARRRSASGHSGNIPLRCNGSSKLPFVDAIKPKVAVPIPSSEIMVRLNITDHWHCPERRLYYDMERKINSPVSARAAGTTQQVNVMPVEWLLKQKLAVWHHRAFTDHETQKVDELDVNVLLDILTVGQKKKVKISHKTEQEHLQRLVEKLIDEGKDVDALNQGIECREVLGPWYKTPFWQVVILLGTTTLWLLVLDIRAHGLAEPERALGLADFGILVWEGRTSAGACQTRGSCGIIGPGHCEEDNVLLGGGYPGGHGRIEW